MADTNLRQEAAQKADQIDVTDKEVTYRGLPAGELADEDLTREVNRLHETRHETFLKGSTAALKAHTERMLELEAEFVRRFPDRAQPDPLRVRETSRQMDGRDA
jgi:collagenase-like PrtC family protease